MTLLEQALKSVAVALNCDYDNFSTNSEVRGNSVYVRFVQDVESELPSDYAHPLAGDVVRVKVTVPRRKDVKELGLKI